MSYTVIEPDGTTSYILFKGRSVGMTSIVSSGCLESLRRRGKPINVTTVLEYMESCGQEYHKRLSDGSTQKLVSRHRDLAFHEAGITEKMNNAIKESVEELVLAVTDQFLQEKELRRKTRNKRKATKRKGKK